nr:PREDICTED: uncharacterized protein LOC105662572 [Megachile rotundata]
MTHERRKARNNDVVAVALACLEISRHFRLCSQQRLLSSVGNDLCHGTVKKRDTLVRTGSKKTERRNMENWLENEMVACTRALSAEDELHGDRDLSYLTHIYSTVRMHNRRGTSNRTRGRNRNGKCIGTCMKMDDDCWSKCEDGEQRII